MWMLRIQSLHLVRDDSVAVLWEDTYHYSIKSLRTCCLSAGAHPWLMHHDPFLHEHHAAAQMSISSSRRLSTPRNTLRSLKRTTALWTVTRSVSAASSSLQPTSRYLGPKSELKEEPYVLLQVMIKRLGTGAIFRPKSGRYDWFTKLVSGHGVNH